MNLGSPITYYFAFSSYELFRLKVSTIDVEGYLGDYFYASANNKNYLVDFPEVNTICFSIENYFRE